MRIIHVFFLWAILHGSSALASPEDGEPAPFLIDKMNGWKLENSNTGVEVMRTTDGEKNWSDVSPPALVKAVGNTDPGFYSDLASLSPLDAKRAWLAISLQNQVILEYTSSGGRDWKESVGPEAHGQVFLSFLNKKEGFVLTAIGFLGHDEEALYHTMDGARQWETLGSPSSETEGMSYYATGITFRTPQEGWISATYHGTPDAPLFHTSNGGKTWQIQSFEIPDDYRGGYADTYPPVFTGVDQKHGYLPVKLVRHEPKPGHTAWVDYETTDGGLTWHLPASSIHSLPDN